MVKFYKRKGDGTMKKGLLVLSTSMILLMYGCSGGSEEVVTKESVKKEEVVEEEKAVEPSGLKLTKDEFIEKFNTSIDTQELNQYFKIDDSLQNQFIKIGIIENEDGYLEHVTYLFDTFEPAPHVKLLLSVFSPKILPENMPRIMNFNFGLYEDQRDLEYKNHEGKAIIGDNVYELSTTDVSNKRFEIVVRQYTGD